MPPLAETVRSDNLLHKTILLKKCTPSIIRKLVHDQPEVLNDVNSQKCTPLHFALYHCPRYNIIYELLRLGADVHAFEERQLIPLDIVLVKYIQDIIWIKECLLEYNVNLDQINWDKFLFGNVKESLLLLLKSPVRVPIATAVRLNQCLNNMPKYVAAAKLLLEFGSKKVLLSKISTSTINVFKYSVKITKVLLQFSTIKMLKKCQSVVKNLYFPHQYYDFIAHRYSRNLESLNAFECESELLTFRDTLVSELIDMMKEKIDESYTLFSFVSEYCSSGLSCCDLEMSAIVKILSTFHFKEYTCSYDLIDASLKRHHLLSHLYKLDIYVRKPISKIFGVGKKIVLNYIAMSYLVEYLSKKDIMNLILAYSSGVEYKEKFLVNTFSVNQNSRIEISNEFSNCKKAICSVKNIKFIY